MCEFYVCKPKFDILSPEVTGKNSKMHSLSLEVTGLFVKILCEDSQMHSLCEIIVCVTKNTILCPVLMLRSNWYEFKNA